MCQPPHPDSEFSLFHVSFYSLVASFVISRFVESTYRLLARVYICCFSFLLLRMAECPLTVLSSNFVLFLWSSYLGGFISFEISLFLLFLLMNLSCDFL